MNIDDILKELYSHSLHSVKLGLKNTEDICEAMGNPQNDYKVIHVGGTNGKGSTSTAIESVLLETWKNIGKYTSPHILKFNERISFNGINISDEDVAKYYLYVKNIVKELNIFPTFFEITTAMMFKYFSDKKVEYAIIEVGLGGRFDSTNIVKSDICVITNISLDHTEYLGETLEEIAFEKAGIIKENSFAVIGSSDINLIKNIKEKTNNFINVLEKYKNISYKLNFEDYTTDINLKNEIYKFSLFGNHQYKNFLCAYEVLKYLNISDRTIQDGIKKIKWQCRFEVIKENDQIIILDGAHNEDGILSLCETLRTEFEKKEIVAIVSILKDKNYKKMISILENNVDNIIFTSLKEKSRGQSAKELFEESNKIDKCFEENILKAYNFTKNQNKKVILICGSFYLLSEFKKVVCL